MSIPRSPTIHWYVLAAVLGGALALVGHPTPAAAQCTSSNPADWPNPARPYFMLVVDTSGSMITCTNPPSNYPYECPANYTPNSCGMVPMRVNDAKCALRQTVQAFGGLVNFGLATFSSILSNCPAGTCQSDCGAMNGGYCGSDIYGCSWSNFPNAPNGCSNSPACSTGPGPSAPNLPEGTWLNGANIVVPMQQDPWWAAPPPPASNVSELLKWFDGDCGDSKELYAGGWTPTAPALRAIGQYLRAGWSRWTNSNYCTASYTDPTPLNSSDRECRSINIILVTDGAPTACETGTSAGDNAAAAAVASDLYNNGVTIGSLNWNVRTYVINFAGGNQAYTDAIAVAGGTGGSLFAANEVQLAQALAAIIAGATPPEDCDNVDNNCNGCVDEGFAHYCHQGGSSYDGAQCCTWTTTAQRDACIANYEASIPSNPPNGDVTRLPCTSTTEQQDSDYWLCYDPEEICDGIDNNCDGQIDEGFTKCGNPLHCPEDEVCDGEDNNCDGQIDDHNICGSCVPSPEVCNGCDDDCDGTVDNVPAGGFPTIDCGLPAPANCVGTRTCQAPTPASGGAGTCNAGAGYGACTNNPQTEVCDGVDNDCNGQIDEITMGAACEPAANVSPHNHYGGTSRCTYGTEACVNGAVVCQGGTTWINEICNGIDDDCDGQVDEAGDIPLVGTQCGSNTSPCTPGTWKCQGGTMVCDGGTPPGVEICNGIDDDCDGAIDEPPLTDAPAPGQYGCWTNAGSTCSHANLSWDPPPGANCHDVGSLTSPCNTGVLTCDGANFWVCRNPTEPTPEVCDNVDNDCDGQVDESDSATALMQDCYSPGLGTNTGCTGYDPAQCTGECRPGSRICGYVSPGIWSDCVGEVVPTAEVCDGLDNDCDGDTDEEADLAWIGQPCPPSWNVCNGILDCHNGQQVCVGGSTTLGRCNGLDDDCDGVTDELDELQQDPLYNQPCGDATGICEEGTYECIGGGWVCVGSVEPGSEVCNGLDDDCDGVIDDAADCPPVGSTDYYCIEGSCRPECDPSNEFPCPGGLDCLQRPSDGQPIWVCMPHEGDCGGATCPAGWICQNDQCVDPCANVVCDNWEECRSGMCVDITCTGVENPCAQGEFCVNHACEPDPCASLDCEADGGYCVRDCDANSCDAQCVDLCLCPTGQYCDAQGECVEDPCYAVSCGQGERCDPATGTCEPDPCAQSFCESFEICWEGDCIDDPCRAVDCPPFFDCVVRPEDPTTTDASPMVLCEPGAAYWVPGDSGGSITTGGGGGCACSQPGAGGGPAGLALALLLSLWLFVRRRFARAPRRGGRQ